VINFLITLMHAIILSVRYKFDYVCCMLLIENNYTCHLQDATTVELAVKQFISTSKSSTEN